MNSTALDQSGPTGNPILRDAQRTSPFFSRWMLLLLILSMGVRLAAAWYWHCLATPDNHYFRFGDSHSYWVLAEQIAKGEPYQYGSPNGSIFRAPMMPLLLSLFTLIPDDYWAILCARMIAGAGLGTCAVALVGLLAGRLAGSRAALAAVALTCCYPSAIGMSIIILSEMLFIPLMLLYLLLWHFAWQAQCSARRLRFSLLTGIVGGLAVLTRPSWLLFTPMIAVIGLLGRRSRCIHLQIVVTIGLGMCLTMTPWWIRNYNVTGKFVLTTLQVGPSLYDSLHPEATGGSDEGMQFMRQFELEQAQVDLSTVGSLESTFEWRINRRAQAAAVDWAKNNLGEVLKLAWAKFYKTWSLWPDGGDVGSPSIRLAITVSSLAVLMLAIAGSLRSWSSNKLMLAICWSPCLYFTSLHMVFVGSVRYREPAMIALIAVAGCGLAALISNSHNSQQESSSVEPALPDRFAS